MVNFKPTNNITDLLKIKVVEPVNKNNLKKQKEENIPSNLISWDNYYLAITKAIALRSSCLRKQVGCIVVRDKQILSTGYNGAPSGRKSCAEDYGFCYRDKHSIKSGTHIESCLAAGCHAELNAIINAAKNGIALKGGTLYLSGHLQVCEVCKAAIINAGIIKVIVENYQTKQIEIFSVKEEWAKHSLEKTQPEYFLKN